MKTAVIKEAGFILPPKRTAGFTLMELMITVAIIGILAAIVMPSYTKYVQKTKRSDAKVELMKIAQMQESYFVQNMSYAMNLTQLGFGNNTMPSENHEYNVSVSAKTPATCTGTSAGTACTAFTLQAVPSAGQASDSECLNFTLTNTGAKGISGSGTAAKCWK